MSYSFKGFLVNHRGVHSSVKSMFVQLSGCIPRIFGYPYWHLLQKWLSSLQYAWFSGKVEKVVQLPRA
ncbi:hypothetical protein BBH88_18690 (plasmid) [Planococcus antarcticus DSM 14505]|uniref:Transposase n=1 Tax=Planococcus antarcticus DSM 14505 TaxID=1185653 RepID=A0ABM6DA57_9BACL|nr:hypothetical protein BBH88_18690 [Planococcus antarcticus DSM 14505]